MVYTAETKADLAERDGVRLPAVEGSRNLRDLGGYATTDGRTVRWGRLYRSGTLARLTEAGVGQLAMLGLRGVCDLRSTSEQVAEPYRWCMPLGLSYWSRDYATSFGELRALMASDLPSADAAREAMLSGYRDLPYGQAPAYRELFRRIADDELPLVVNCSAGKDRAGTAAALVLSALGVPRETVVEDYVLTDRVWDYRAAMLGPGSAIGRQPAGVIEAVFAADPAYIASALDSIEARSGSLEAYLRDILDIDADRLAAVRFNLLT